MLPENKKRKINLDEDVSFVFVPSEKLLVMSSQELEGRVNQLTSIRSLTSVELKEVKRQIRLVKNREYAQSSRIKKKQQVEELRDENLLLRERVQLLEEENRKLKIILEAGCSCHSGSSLPSSPSVEFPSSPSTSDFSDFSSDSSSSSSPGFQNFFESEDVQLFSSTDVDIPALPDFKNTLSLSGSFTNTFCLFMIMLSFGVFFSSFTGFSDFRMMSNINNQLPFSLGLSGETSFHKSGRALLQHEHSPPISTQTETGVGTSTNVRQSVRKEISYYEVLLDEMNHTSVKSHA